MKFLRPILVLPCFLVTCCVSAPPPEPAPPPIPVAQPDPATRPSGANLPTSLNWMDAPATLGDWTYRNDGSGTMASFGTRQGEPSFALRCDRTNGTVSLIRAGTASGTVPMRVRTETLDRMLSARQLGDQLPALRADLPSRDSLLEAMAFSKGRFAVETQGMETLYIPAWPEVTRVVEDCR